MTKDNIFADPQALTDFAFDEQVVEVFEDMIQRSVPGYTLMLELIGLVAHRYVKPGSTVYDLGCSLGASTLAIRHNIDHEDCRIIAIDNSEEMVHKCVHVMAEDEGKIPVLVQHGDILSIEYSEASLIVMNLTLQFVPISERNELLQTLYNSLMSGGVLILSEKITGDSSHTNTLLIDLYHDFKRRQGYSELEISQKRDALENILLPESLETHRERLINTGFTVVAPWFQSFNFVSLIAIK